VRKHVKRRQERLRALKRKHFEFSTQPVTYVTKEYPADWQPGKEAYYSVNNESNQKLYQQYTELAAKEENVIFGGRLAEYKYYDMDDVIKSALECAGRELK
jgi:UDP-galactopyranose mutase